MPDNRHFRFYDPDLVAMTFICELDIDILKMSSIPTSSSAIAERPLCRVGCLWPKVEDWIWGTTHHGHMSLFNHCDVMGLQSYRIR